MSVGEDNNRQTDRQTYSSQTGTNLYKSCSNQMWYKINVVGVYVVYPKVGEDNNRQTDRHNTVAKKAQTYIKC